jgi:integrase
VIRQEIVKRGSFGRTIQLTKSPELLRTYIRTKKLEGDEFLFTLTSASANKYLQRHAKDLFGTSMTKGGQSYHKISLYDFRHIACCYWSKILNRDRDIMQRFGWKQSNKIYYYSKFIDDEDKENLTIDTETAELQRRLEIAEKDKVILENKYVEIAEMVKEMKAMIKSQQVQPAVQVT